MSPGLDTWSLIVMVTLIVNLTECRVIQEAPVGIAVEDCLDQVNSSEELP